MAKKVLLAKLHIHLPAHIEVILVNLEGFWIIGIGEAYKKKGREDKSVRVVINEEKETIVLVCVPIR